MKLLSIDRIYQLLIRVNLRCSSHLIWVQLLILLITISCFPGSQLVLAYPVLLLHGSHHISIIGLTQIVRIGFSLIWSIYMSLWCSARLSLGPSSFLPLHFPNWPTCSWLRNLSPSIWGWCAVVHCTPSPLTQLQLLKALILDWPHDIAGSATADCA